MNKSTYRNISDFGSNAYAPVNNPLTYCLNNTMDQRFLHGSSSDTMGQHSKSCQMFLSDYCSDKWDGFCEVASKNTATYLPNIAPINCDSTGTTSLGLTAGESLIHNTAKKKYLVSMGNCIKKFEPFDPNVATSPMISYWVPGTCTGVGTCIPVYGVDPNTIDDDIVMNKILFRPVIAIDLLVNIYNSMKRKGTLSKLNGTKLGMFYNANPYFKKLGGV